MSNAAVKLSELPRLSIFERDDVLKKALVTFTTVRTEAEAITDVTEDNIQQATDLFARLKKSEKYFTEKRQEQTRPLKEEAKLVEADFASTVLDPLKKLRSLIEEKILRYHGRKEKEMAEARERVLAAQRAAEEQQAREREEAQRLHQASVPGEASLPPLPFEEDPPPAVEEALPALELAMPEAPRSFKGEFGTVSIAKEWKAEVQDVTKLLLGIAGGLAPTDCITVNESFLHKLAVERQGKNPPPGVAFVQKSHTITR